jgi:predicted anti-sigma-YlaC factor YlaD
MSHAVESCAQGRLRPNPQAATMTCKETIRLICEYLDGKLVPSVDRDIRAHLDECRECRMVRDAASRMLKANSGSAPVSSSQRKSRVA